MKQNELKWNEMRWDSHNQLSSSGVIITKNKQKWLTWNIMVATFQGIEKCQEFSFWNFKCFKKSNIFENAVSSLQTAKQIDSKSITRNCIKWIWWEEMWMKLNKWMNTWMTKRKKGVLNGLLLDWGNIHD